MGFVNKVLPPAEVLAFAQAQAPSWWHCRHHRYGQPSVNEGKQIAAVEAKIKEESVLFSEMLLSREAKEAFTAFFEKRKPDFTKFK